MYLVSAVNEEEMLQWIRLRKSGDLKCTTEFSVEREK